MYVAGRRKSGSRFESPASRRFDFFDFSAAARLSCELPPSLPDAGEGASGGLFHAASVGELESLWPRMERAANDRSISYHGDGLFEFGLSHLHKMARRSKGGRSTGVLSARRPLAGGASRRSAKLICDRQIRSVAGDFGTRSHELRRFPSPSSGRSHAVRFSGEANFAPPRESGTPVFFFFSFDPENEPAWPGRFPDADLSTGPILDGSGISARIRTRIRGDRTLSGVRDLPRPWGVSGALGRDLTRAPSTARERGSGHALDRPPSNRTSLRRRDGNHPAGSRHTPVRTSTPELIRPAGKSPVLVDGDGVF